MAITIGHGVSLYQLCTSGITAENLDAAGPVRFLMVATTFLPAMAILGAKRPQHGAWQLIVLTLWVTLIWPALESLLLGWTWELHRQPVRGGFVVILLVVQLSNWLPTRYLGPVALLTAAQTILLWPQLPWSGGARLGEWDWPLGVGCLGMVPLLIRTQITKPPMASAEKQTPGLTQRAALTLEANVDAKASRDFTPDRFDLAALANTRYAAAWREFRDLYGVVWGLRVQERINEVARLQHWGLELTWAGFVPVEEPAREQLHPQPGLNAYGRIINDEPVPDQATVAAAPSRDKKVVAQPPPAETLHQIQQAWETIWRRFVSARWIEERVGLFHNSSIANTFGKATVLRSTEEILTHTREDREEWDDR
ncbi:MAG: hypothetical protein SFX18_18355 [Pirellulales bacterium]|nr:hypothetical protein [Pirellulales bacterium]